MRTLLVLLLTTVALCAADKKKTITNEAGNDNVDMTANPLITPEAIRAALGDDLPAGVVAVEMKIVPKGDFVMSVSVNDFVLLSHKDGQRSAAYVPSQIAGSATMVVKTQGVGGGGIGRQRTGPVWGGIPGTGGRPVQTDQGGGGIGNSGGSETKTSAEIKDDAKGKSNPLLKRLAEKMLPEKETNEPVSGLLYFPLEGKVKTKDLELIYQGPAGRLYVEFR